MCVSVNSKSESKSYHFNSDVCTNIYSQCAYNRTHIEQIFKEFATAAIQTQSIHSVSLSSGQQRFRACFVAINRKKIFSKAQFRFDFVIHGSRKRERKKTQPHTHTQSTERNVSLLVFSNRTVCVLCGSAMLDANLLSRKTFYAGIFISRDVGSAEGRNGKHHRKGI